MNLREELVREALSASPEKAREALEALRGKQVERAKPGLLDVPGACAFLGGMARVTLWRHRQRGLRTVRLKGRVMFRVSDLEAYIDQNDQTTPRQEEKP